MQNLQSIDSTGPGVVIQGFQELQKADQVLSLAAVPERIEAILLSSGLDKFIPVFSEAKALADSSGIAP